MEFPAMLLLELNDGRIIVAETDKGKPVVATTGNEHLLAAIGSALLDEGRIAGYQLVRPIVTPVHR